MNKREVKHYLETQERNAIRKLNNARSKTVESMATERVTESLEGLSVDSINRRIKGLNKELEQITSKLKKCEEFEKYGPVFDAVYQLNRVISAGVFDSLVGSMSIRHYKNIEPNTTYKANAEKLKTQFKILYSNTSGMTGKQATEYLESLGFETPKKVIKQKQEILAPVDIDFIKRLK